VSVRDECRSLLAEARGIAGSDCFGLHPFRVYLRTTSSSGSHTGDGTLTSSEVEILEDGSPPKVTKPGATRAGGEGDRIMFSDDAADSDVFMIGPLTPVASSSWSSLTGGGVSAGESWHLRVRHVETGEDTICRVVDVDDQSSLHVTITAIAVSGE